MNLPSQVISLPLAKRLKELGAPQKDTLVIWRSVESVHPAYNVEWRLIIDSCLDFGDRDVAAYTVAELGEMLPATVSRIEGNSGRINHWLVMDKGDNPIEYNIYYQSTNDEHLCLQSHHGEAEARGLMLCWLIENGYIFYKTEGLSDKS